MMRVALMGPVSNIALSFAAALLFRATGALPGFFPNFQATLRNALLFAVSLNLFLAFFNLLPIHPLDGSKVLAQLLPLSARRRYERMAPYGIFIIFGLVSMGIMHALVTRPSLAALELYRRMGLIW
jgi:Zn-dependent protease